MCLIWEIEKHLERTGTPPTRFGKEALGDPMLLRDLRRGRELRPVTLAKLRRYMRAKAAA